ncbi:MAG: hypothetical protein WC821_00535 [archaeon]|jgi:hypothetical protein
MSDTQSGFVGTSSNKKYEGKEVVFVNKKEARQRKQNAYTFEELYGFYTGIYHAYQSIVYQGSNAIISPLRGAEPLVKSINLLATYEGNNSRIPRLYYPRVGQVNYGETKKVVAKVNPDFASTRTQIATEQKREMRRTLESIIKTNNPIHDSRKRIVITLLDEVFSGGALAKNFSIMEEALNEINAERIKRRLPMQKVAFNVIAIADSGVKRCSEYQHLKSMRMVKEFVVPRLFTTDNPRFLFPLIKTKDPSLWEKMRRGTRPKLGITRKAIEGRDALLSDLQALHSLRLTRGVNTQEGVLRLLSSRVYQNAHCNGAKSAAKSCLGFTKNVARLKRLHR